MEILNSLKKSFIICFTLSSCSPAETKSPYVGTYLDDYDYMDIIRTDSSFTRYTGTPELKEWLRDYSLKPSAPIPMNWAKLEGGTWNVKENILYLETIPHQLGTSGYCYHKFGYAPRCFEKISSEVLNDDSYCKESDIIGALELFLKSKRLTPIDTPLIDNYIQGGIEYTNRYSERKFDCRASLRIPKLLFSESNQVSNNCHFYIYRDGTSWDIEGPNYCNLKIQNLDDEQLNCSIEAAKSQLVSFSENSNFTITGGPDYQYTEISGGSNCVILLSMKYENSGIIANCMFEVKIVDNKWIINIKECS